MQTFTTLMTLAALATSAFALPSNSNSGPSARAAAASKRGSYCPATVDITAFGAPPEQAQNHIYGVPVFDYYTDLATHGYDISTSGDDPALSISSVTWTNFNTVTCVFAGVDSKNDAPPVLSNEVDYKWQVGPPQTLIEVVCFCP